MTQELRIGLIGLGEVGRVLAEDLHREVVEVCAWDRLFPVAGSAPRCADRRAEGSDGTSGETGRHFG